MAAAAAAAAAAAVETGEADDGAAAMEDSLTAGMPLFEGIGDQEISAISVIRMEPVEEGHLGQIDPGSDIEVIRRRWGGGVFKIIAKGSTGQIRGPQRTVTVAGDPKFASRDALLKYRVKMGEVLPEPEKPAAAPAAAPLGIGEIIALINQGHAQQIEMMRIQIEASRQEHAAREAASRREAEERVARERREADERAERDRRYHEEQRERDRQFQASVKPHAGGEIGVLLKGLALGRELAGEKGGEPGDIVSRLLDNLPAVFEAFKGGGPAGAGAPALQPSAPGDPSLRLRGAPAQRIVATIEALKGKGYSEDEARQIIEAGLLAQMDALSHQVPNRPPIDGQAASPAEPLPPPPASPPDDQQPIPMRRPDVTAAPRRATRRG